MKNYYYITFLGLLLCTYSCRDLQDKNRVDSETEALNDSLTKAAIAEYKTNFSDVSEDVDTVQYVSASQKTMEIIFKNEASENRTLDVKLNSNSGFVPYLFETQKNNITTFKRENSRIDYNEDTRNCTLIEGESKTEFEMN